MNVFRDRIANLSRDQLAALAERLQDELLCLRPDETPPGPDPRHLLYRTRWVETPFERAELKTAGSAKLVLAMDTASTNGRPEGDFVATIILEERLISDAAALRRRLEDVATRAGGLDGIVYSPAAWTAPVEGRLPPFWCAALMLAQALVGWSGAGRPRLWFATRSAQPTGAAGEVTDPWQTPLAALGKTLSLECPSAWGGAVDLGPDTDFATVMREIAVGEADEVAWRGGRRLTPMLERAPEPPTLRAYIRADATYLVTGGLGGIGGVLAAHLLQQGVGGLAVLARPCADAAQRRRRDKALATWRALRPDAQLQILEADVCDRDAVARAVKAASSALPLRGVFHAAGVNRLTPLASLSYPDVQDIFDAKVLGALYLHESTAGLDLDFQVYFSSVAGGWGTSSMAPYAMANRFLDAFAHWRDAIGLRTCCIAWGPWADVGMIVNQQKTGYTRLGFGLIAPAEGVALIDGVLASGAASATAVDLDWNAYAAAVGDARHLAPFASLQASPAPAQIAPERVATAGAPAGFSDQEAVAAFLRRTISGLMGGGVAVEEDERPLQDLGMTSLLGVELSQAVTRTLGVRCRPTIMFDFPTIADMAVELSGRWAAANPSLQVAAQADTPRPGATGAGRAIAIVGMACRLPGAASPAELWDLVAGGQAEDAIQPVPKARFDVEAFLSASDQAGKAYTLAGGYLDDLAGFDHQRFQISRAEAELMDPQQRLALETVWRAFEDGGIDPAGLASSGKARNSAVFFGVGQNEYGPLCRSALASDHAGLMATGQSMNIIAGRIAYQFGFCGPAIAFDTACSSSLVALDAAVRQLRQGGCDLAVVGGVNALVSPETFVLLSKAGALSRQGRCAAFDADADGYVRAEGCVAFLLKREEDALREGDRIHALIQGSAVNHDGRSSGLTAPSGRAQEEVIRAALKDGGVQPADVCMVEAHGTGTRLGDPIEYHALDAVYGAAPGRKAPLFLGTVKSVIGHAEAAAGLSGVLKLVLSLQNRQAPAQRNHGRLNPFIEASEAIVIPSANSDLGQGRLLGGVSAFGFSGTNAHVILEAAHTPGRARLPPAPFARVRCWYSQRPLAETTALAKVFGQAAGEEPVQDPGTPKGYTTHLLTVAAPRLGAVPASVIIVREAAGRGAVFAAVKAGLDSRGIGCIETTVESCAASIGLADTVVLVLEHGGAGGGDADAPEQMLEREFPAVAAVLKALTRPGGGRRQAARLVMLCRADADSGEVGPRWGAFMATARKEHQNLAVTVAELPIGGEAAAAERHLDALLRLDEPTVLVGEAHLRVPRLRRMPVAPAPFRFRSDRTVLVSGGHGGVGRALAAWAAAQGAGAILTVGRRAPDREASADFAVLERRYGVLIRTVAADVADFNDLQAALSAPRAALPPIGSVFHCAGVVDDRPIALESWDGVAAALRPKLFGAANLARLAADEPLQHLVCFSSLAGLLGNGGQAAYAVANAMLDRMAARLRASGRPALAVDWGPWRDTGMARGAAHGLQATQARIGLAASSPQACLDALGTLLARLDSGDPPPPRVGLFRLDWTRYAVAEGADPLIEDLLQTAPIPEPASGGLRDMLLSAPPDQRSAELRRQVRRLVAECLGLSDDAAVDVRCGFADLGVDSLHSSILHRKLEAATASYLPSTVSFDYPTVIELADFLREQIFNDVIAPVCEASGSMQDDNDLLETFEDGDLVEMLRAEIQKVTG